MDPSINVQNIGDFEISTEKIKGQEEQTEIIAKGKWNGKDVVIKTTIPTEQGNAQTVKETINAVIIKADQLAKAFGLGSETKSIAVSEDTLETHSFSDSIESGTVKEVAEKFFKNCAEEALERREILGKLAGITEHTHSSKTEETKRAPVKPETQWKAAAKSQGERATDLLLGKTRKLSSEMPVDKEESIEEPEVNQKFREKFDALSKELDDLVKKYDMSEEKEFKDEIRNLQNLRDEIVGAPLDKKEDLSNKLERNMLNLHFLGSGNEAMKMIDEWKPKENESQIKVTQGLKDLIKNIRGNFKEAFTIMEGEHFSEKDISKLNEIKSRLNGPLEELKKLTQLHTNLRSGKTPEVEDEFEEEYVPVESLTEASSEELEIPKEGKEEEVESKAQDAVDMKKLMAERRKAIAPEEEEDEEMGV